jgi:hypothetical protein
MRRWPLTGLLILPVALYLAAVAARPLPPPRFDPQLKPRPRWTPPPEAPELPALGGEPRRPPAGIPSPPATNDAPGRAATRAPAATESTTRVAPTGAIPDVDSDALLGALTRAGLECSSVSLDTGGLTWTCSADRAQATYLVVIHGARTDSITRLRATVTRAATDFIAARFLSSLAGLSYAGAEPARASDWVTRNLAADGSVTIGPVRFVLSGAAGARTLDVVAEEPSR